MLHLRGTCPFCKTPSSFEPGYHQSNSAYEPGPNYAVAELKGWLWWIGICNSCEMPVLVDDARKRILPKPGAAEVPKYVPKKIAKFVLQARTSSIHECPDATASMIRRSVEEICSDMGASTGKLHQKIDELKERGLIPLGVAESFHELRWLGNDGSHDNKIEVTNEDAEHGNMLLDLLLDHIYWTSATLQKISKTSRKTRALKPCESVS